MNKSFLKINGNIKADFVRLIDQDGQMVGVVTLEAAIAKAKAVNMDLLEVMSQSNPIVCKIIGAEGRRKLKDSKKKQKATVFKEIRVRPNIGDKDLRDKIKQIHDFINDGCKVKVSLNFKGREIVHIDVGMKVIDEILNELVEHERVVVEHRPKLEGRQITMLLGQRKALS